MASIYKKIEVAANIAIILVASLLGLVLIMRYFSPASATDSQHLDARIQNGTKLSLPEVNWTDADQTLLLVLKTGCHFCSESALFYQRIAEETTKRSNVRLIAVMPDPSTEAQNYLASLGLSIKEIKQIQLNLIEVKGTPTLILVDKQGSVVNSWVGKLTPDKEAQVLARLQCENCLSSNLQAP